MNTLTIEAPSIAAFVSALASLDRETHAIVTATESGKPWATVRIAPMTDTTRSIFPCYLGTSATGDSRKRGQSGAWFRDGDARQTLTTVVNRAARMAG